MILIVLVLVFAIILSGLYSGSETGMYAFNLLQVSKKDGGKFKSIKRLFKKRDSIVIACLVGTNVAVELATLSFGQGFKNLNLGDDKLLHIAELVFLIPVLFLVGEVLPKSLLSVKANVILPKLTWFLWGSRFVFYPVIVIMQAMVRVFSWFVGNTKDIEYTQSRQRLKWVLQDSEGGLSSEQSRMVRNVLDLQDRQVVTIMKSLNNVDMVPSTITLKELKDKFHSVASNYLLVYDGQINNVVGVVFVSPVLLAEEGANIKDFLVSIPSVTSKENLTAALHILKSDNRPVATVISDNGNVLGLVFTRQIIKEVVGDMPGWLYS